MPVAVRSCALLLYGGLSYVNGAAEHVFYRVGVVLKSRMPCDYPKVIPASVDAMGLGDEEFSGPFLTSIVYCENAASGDYDSKDQKYAGDLLVKSFIEVTDCLD